MDDSKLNRYEILNENGKLYSVTTGPQSVAASGYLVLEINNLAGSNKWMEVVRIEGGVNAVRISISYAMQPLPHQELR